MTNRSKFYHLTEGGEEGSQICAENEDDDAHEYEDTYDADGIVNPTRPR